ncbi:hypothetical protein T265_06111 [Opisthorchis viverrini]|uniref:RBR-type E3 ubiquitin transferase n=1 Tax=Opisthorchis viverrini TaxID=6198 RepID=A0A074ZTI7_OPIVI|nr:hypothetical protein T265_06111 [Opisthorchis viverrini]KER26675.1 hypothetical protein T265_06111 [Opisthorchis viverrini]
MCSPAELQSIEIEAMRSACSASDLQVSFRYSDTSSRGTFCIFADLPGHSQLYLHAPASKLQVNNNFIIDKLAEMWIYGLKHLPPIYLKFQLPPNYPGSDTDPVVPELLLESAWLPKSVLSHLTEQLNKLSLSSPGELILWSLAEFLRSESHQFLLNGQAPSSTKSTHLDLFHFYDCYHDEVSLSLSQCTELLISNNDDRLDAEFYRTARECPVCLETKLGSNFFRFHVCQHAVCLECVRQAFVLAVDSGLTAQQLGCLICDTTAGVNEARFVLPPATFKRYEALLLNRSLNMMSDIAYCPRSTCQNMPVILDDTDLGRCTNCGFAFCPRCLRPYHGADQCVVPAGKKTPSKEPDELTEEEFLAREKENWASYDYVDEHCKYCPGCWSPVEKDSGCNKMTCPYCRTRYCWLCLQILHGKDPYDHFRSGGPCNGRLFVGLEEDEEDGGE